MPNIETLSISRQPGPENVVSLLNALQYGSGTGDAALLKWASSFTKRVFEPAYTTFEILLNSGNTDGWCKIVRMLCESGDSILCEEHTYPSAQSVWIPMGCKAVPIKMDGGGMRADELERTLAQWEMTNPETKRPHM